MKVIDFRVRLRTKELLAAWVPEPAPYFKPYVELYKMKPRLSFMTVEENLAEMESHGISSAVVCAGNVGENSLIADLCKKYPDRLIGVAAVDPEAGPVKSYDALKRAYEDYGLSGLSLTPYICGVRANDPRNYPLFTLSVLMNKPVIIHTSLHFNLLQPLDLGNPKYFDQVAVHFPELRMIMSHAGNGFGLLPLAMAQRHPNIYLEFSALRPKYVRSRVIHAANSFLKEKCIFGTDYPLLPFEVVEDWKRVIRPENHSSFFHANALRALGELL